MIDDAYWNEVRARSEEMTASGMKMHCAVCWISFNYGAPAEGRPLPCPKHATPEERARADRMMASPEFGASLRNHPLLSMTRRRGT